MKKWKKMKKNKKNGKRPKMRRTAQSLSPSSQQQLCNAIVYLSNKE